jgi:hypothetical protein
MNKIIYLLLCMAIAINTYAQNDCSSAIDLCSNTGQASLNNGQGTEECSGLVSGYCFGCFGSSGEHNSVWYRMVVQTAGDFQFEIIPQGTSDYDWAVWNQGNGGSCPSGSQLDNPTSCNWAPGSGDYTGISSNGNEPNSGDPGSDTDWEPDFTVNAGDVIYILVDNFTDGSTVGFDINFFLTESGVGSTATFNCAAANTCSSCSDADCGIYVYSNPSDPVPNYEDATADGACTSPTDVNAQSLKVCGTFTVPMGYVGPGVTLPLTSAVQATTPDVPADCNPVTYNVELWDAACGGMISPSGGVYPVTAGSTYKYCAEIILDTGNIPASCRIDRVCLAPELQPAPPVDCSECIDDPCAEGGFYVGEENVPTSGTVMCTSHSVDINDITITPADGQVDIVNVCFDFTVPVEFGNSCADYLSGASALSGTACAFSAANLTLYNQATCTQIPSTGTDDDPLFGLFDTWDASSGVVGGGTYTMCVDFYDVESDDGIADCIASSVCPLAWVNLCASPATTAIVQEEQTDCTPTSGNSTSQTGGGAGITCGGYTGNGDDSQWYAFTSCTTASSVTVTVDGDTGYDAVVFLYAVLPCQNCPDAAPIACADATASGGIETINNAIMPSTTYYIRVYDYSSGGGTYSICVNGAPIDCVPAPVELLSFSGKALDKSNELTWKTASERNNSHFEVERTADGRRFTTIGKVAGSGNSTVERTYTFTDESPIAKAYYRIKQVDFDGQFSYSRTLMLERARSWREFTLYPSPLSSNSDLTLSFSLDRAQPMDIRLVDTYGRTLLHQTFEGQKGENIRSLEAAQLPSGIYFAIMSDGNEMSTQKIVKYN